MSRMMTGLIDELQIGGSVWDLDWSDAEGIDNGIMG